MGVKGEILVVNATGEPFTFPPQGIEIQTTGEVRQFDIGSVTQEFDLELQPEAYKDYENQPVIIAHNYCSILSNSTQTW